jgi:hypothetical protein
LVLAFSDHLIFCPLALNVDFFQSSQPKTLHPIPLFDFSSTNVLSMSQIAIFEGDNLPPPNMAIASILNVATAPLPAVKLERLYVVQADTSKRYWNNHPNGDSHDRVQS